MHSVRLEPTKLILIGTPITYQATGVYLEKSLGKSTTITNCCCEVERGGIHEPTIPPSQLEYATSMRFPETTCKYVCINAILTQNNNNSQIFKPRISLPVVTTFILFFMAYF